MGLVLRNSGRDAFSQYHYYSDNISQPPDLARRKSSNIILRVVDSSDRFNEMITAFDPRRRHASKQQRITKGDRQGGSLRAICAARTRDLRRCSRRRLRSRLRRRSALSSTSRISPCSASSLASSAASLSASAASEGADSESASGTASFSSRFSCSRLQVRVGVC